MEKTTLESRMMARLGDREPGWVFTVTDFADLADQAAIRGVLEKCIQARIIRRLASDIELYELPRFHPTMGVLEPSLRKIAMALRDSEENQIVPAGEYAAYLMRFTDRLPAQVLFFTDGSARQAQVCNHEILLQHAGSFAMSMRRERGLMVRGLEFIGRDRVDQAILDTLLKRYKNSDLLDMGGDYHFVPAWIREILTKLAAGRVEVESPKALRSEEDWRVYDNADELQGLFMIRKQFRDIGQDHDHCVLCHGTFSEYEHPGHMAEGYWTVGDAGRSFDPGRCEWICDQCFADFHQRFGWVVLKEDPWLTGFRLPIAERGADA